MRDSAKQRLIDRCTRLATDYQRAAEVGNRHMQGVLRRMYERAVSELGYDPLAPRRPAPESGTLGRGDTTPKPARRPARDTRPVATREMTCRRCQGPILKGEWYLPGPRGAAGCPGCSLLTTGTATWSRGPR
jgi:hypothetical protein